MENLSKGVRTRNTIISKVNRLFNKEEKLFTLDEIASELKLTKSRITNHFPKKELLILAVYEKYGEQFHKLLEPYSTEKLSEFNHLIELWADIMDLMYEYRFSLSYVFVNPIKDKDLARHFNESYERDKQFIYQLLEFLVQSGKLDPQILTPKNFEVYLFLFTTLFTTWIITLKIYDKAAGYKRMKPLYLEGILGCFIPYLTIKGREEYEKTINALHQLR